MAFSQVHLEALWGLLPPDGVGRLTIARSLSAGDRSKLLASLHETDAHLTAREYTSLAQAAFDDQEAHHLVSVLQIVRERSDIGILVTADMDRPARRWAFSDGLRAMTDSTSIVDVRDMLASLPECDGRDDLLMVLLPMLVHFQHSFDADELARTSGAVAGMQTLAASSPLDLPHDRVWEILTTDLPEKWLEAGTEDRAWHTRSAVRNALSMLFTHRPELAERAATDPRYVPAVLQTPHWRPEFAETIPELDLAAGVLTDAADSGTPHMARSLVWHPHTTRAQAAVIERIAKDAQTSTNFASQWKITEAAAATRQSAHPYDIESLVDGDIPAGASRWLTSRITRATSKSISKGSSHAGHHSMILMEWPDKFGEFIALSMNPKGPHLSIPGIEALIPPVPRGTWTDAVAGPEASGPLPAKRLNGTKVDAWRRRSHVAIPEMQKVCVEFGNLPPEQEAEAWRVLCDFMMTSDFEEDIAETVLALTDF